MRSLSDTDPKQFIDDFFTSFTRELLEDDGDPARIVDRYHTPDIVQFADGHRMDRDNLIAHARPIRKNRPDVRLEVHEAIADGDRIAARYTMRGAQRGKEFAVDVYFFGRFTPDGRMRQGHMATRALPVEGAGGSQSS
jgi:predicted ester cyclase